MKTYKLESASAMVLSTVEIYSHLNKTINEFSFYLSWVQMKTEEWNHK